MLFLSIQVVFVGLIIVGLYALRTRLGLGLIYVFVASLQFVQNLFATTVYVELLGRYPVSPGSAVLFSSSLFALLLIYLKEDIASTRVLIYGILLANLTLAGVAVSTGWGVALGLVDATGPASSWSSHHDMGGFALGSVLFVVDAFLLIILYETFRSRVRWLRAWPRIVLSLSAVLAMDTVIFSGFVFRGEPGMVRMLVGGLAGKALAGVLYGSLLWGYLALSPEATDSDGSRAFRDPLSILTFGQRYQALESEVEQLEQLHERERQRAEVVLRGARLGAWTWHVQTGKTFHDERWAEMLDYAREDIEPRIESWEDRIHPDDRARVMDALHAHLEGATPFYQVEHRLRTRSGSWKWLLSMGKVVERDETGRPKLMTGTHMDIDERKLAGESAARFSAVLENSLNEIYTFDAKTLCFDEVSRGARENLGYSLEELRRLTPLDVKPEFSAESFANLIEPLRRGNRETVDFSTVHLRKNGTRYQVEVRIQLLAEGEPVFVAFVRDITERQQVEHELRRLQHRYRELFEGAPLHYVITENRDEVARVAECNSTFLDRLGYERDEVIGRPLSAFYSVESRAELLAGGSYRYASEADSVRVERQLLTKSGEVVDTLLRALPEKDSDGTVVGARAMYVEITELKKAEAKVKWSEGQLRKLAARMEAVREEERKVISREIHDGPGQALTGLKIDLAWIRGKLEDGPSSLAERADSMLSRIDQTIVEVRDLSARLRPAVLDDLGLVEAVLWQARKFADQSGLECLVDMVPSGAEELDCQPDCATAVFRILQEALTNVLRHAEATRVKITFGIAGSQLVMSVADNGKGVDTDTASDESLLGLLGMRERAERLGGSVEIGPGLVGGTTLTTRIPL